MENIFEEKKDQLPQVLNVLTILTFVGSGLTLLMSILNYFNAEKLYKQTLEAQANLQDSPAFVQKMMGTEMLEITRLSLENKLPLLFFNIIGVALCAFGAVEMRKLKKQGFALWLTGELVPIFVSYILIGASVFTGLSAFGLVFPIAFIVLYATQLKKMN